MRKIKEILRLKLDCGISKREIARSYQVSRSTVADYLRRAAAARLTWTEASVMTESQLEERLFPSEHIPSTVKRPPPDCEHIYNELRTYRKFNLTLSQLWLEYKDKHLDGYQYTEECLNESWFLSLEDDREKVEEWRQHYNRERLYSSLDNMTPVEFAGALVPK